MKDACCKTIKPRYNYGPNSGKNVCLNYNIDNCTCNECDNDYNRTSDGKFCCYMHREINRCLEYSRDNCECVVCSNWETYTPNSDGQNCCWRRPHCAKYGNGSGKNSCDCVECSPGYALSSTNHVCCPPIKGCTEYNDSCDCVKPFKVFNYSLV